MNCPRCTAGPRFEVRHVAVTLAPVEDERRGLLAWAVVDLGAMVIDGVSVRRPNTGPDYVVMPANRRGSGGRYPLVTILDAGLRARIDTAVLAEYARARARAGKAAQ